MQKTSAKVALCYAHCPKSITSCQRAQTRMHGFVSSLPADANTGLGLGAHEDAVVRTIKHIHQSVAAASVNFLAQARRHNYVTPTSYLEVLSTYAGVLSQKRVEVGTLRDRLQVRFSSRPAYSARAEMLLIRRARSARSGARGLRAPHKR
jgi:P-loop containing dynein motor region D4